jgi:hypothetical protein
MSRLSVDDATVVAEVQAALNVLGVGTQGAAVADPAAITAGAAAITGVATTQAGHLSRVVTNVDASAGGTAQTTPIVTVPANSLIVGVEATVVTPFNGATTKTLEVGVTANPDQFIDTVDFDPGAAAGTDAGSIGGANNDTKVMLYTDAAVAIEALWTNVTAATLGSVNVSVIFITFANADMSDQIDALVIDHAALDTEFDLLRTDVAAIRTQLIALLTSLEGGALIAT